MATKIALNGFGRIGRSLTRLLAHDDDLTLAAINARTDNETLAYLLKYDSVHGKIDVDVTPTDKGMRVGKMDVTVTRQQLGDYIWGDLGVDIVIDCTGVVKDHAGLSKHIEKGAAKSIISAPGSDVDFTMVPNVNSDAYDPAKHHVLSSASCTTNCLAPAAKVLNETFGIKHGIMTTVHSYTMDQRLHDGSHKDPRRGRAAAMSMVPTSTGAAKAIGVVMPELKGKLDGFAIRVPTPSVSIVDLTCDFEKPVSVEAINAALKKGSETAPLSETLGYCEEPLVSVDYIGTTFGGVVDPALTKVMGDNLGKVIVWYDNEMGFTHQLHRMVKIVAKGL